MENVKNKILKILKTIKREGSDLDRLIDYLCNRSDFFTAPASTKYHNCFQGGLAQHSLNVYNVLVKLTKEYFPNRYDEDGLKIIGLLHDISKSNYYVKEVKNKKVYRENGSKYDSQGNYDWESYEGFYVKEARERFLFGSHEENSYFMVNQFFPLTVEEATALINHHGGIGDGTSANNKDLSAILGKYPLACLLHAADFIATYALEGNSSNE